MSALTSRIHVPAASFAVVTALTMMVGFGTSFAGSADAAAQAGRPIASQLDFGPNVKIFDPSMPTSEIQATVDAIANQQVTNQFGPQRYALLFKPGTYGSVSAPLNFQVGYYTSVAGLGLSPPTSSSTGLSMYAISATPTAAAPHSTISGDLSRT